MTRSMMMLVLLLTAPTANPAETAPGSPNVLFIAVDDLNTRISCYGDPIAQTPNLNRLAERGVLFDRAYCQFPICNPSRTSLLLGRYPTTTQVVDFCQPALLGPDWVTLPQHFRNQGYDVTLLGKIHHFEKELMRDWFAEPIPGDEYPPDWSAGEKWVRKSQQVHASMLADLTRWEPYRSLTSPPNDWVKSLSTWANVFGPVDNSKELSLPTPLPAYSWEADARSAERAEQLLTRLAASDKPFFLGLGFYKPHVPLVAPQRFFDLYPPASMPLPHDFAPMPRAGDGVPRYALRYNLDLFFEQPVTTEQAQGAMAAYYACVSFMDEKLGQVLDTLDRLKLREKTIIVLWGDHGWHLGEKGMWGKGTLFDVSARTPLIIVDPRRETAGQTCPRTVELVDIYPTLVQLCDLPVPPGLEGMSLVPLLDNPSAPRDKPAYTLTAREDWLARSVRTERWAYTQWDEGRRGEELYDLANDPLERHNLATAPAQAAILAGLRQRLQSGPVAKPCPIPAGN